MDTNFSPKLRDPNRTLGGAQKKSILPKLPLGQSLPPPPPPKEKSEKPPVIPPEFKKQFEKKSDFSPRRERDTTRFKTFSKFERKSLKKEKEIEKGKEEVDGEKPKKDKVPKKDLSENWRLDETQMKDPYYPCVFPFENYREAELDAYEHTEGHFQGKDLVLIQLPSVLPIVPTQEHIDDKPNPAPISSSGASTPTKKPVTITPTKADDDSQKGIQNLPPGQIGTIRVYESGRMEFVLGDIVFELQEGTRPNFVEELMAIDTENKHCNSLGEVTKHYLCVPTLDSLINKAS